MVGIYRFCFGYVKILISGESPERMINQFVKRGVSVWGLKRRSGGISCYISATDFLSLRAIKRKNTGIRIKLLEKHGLPFLKRRVLMRPGVIVGVIFVILLNLFLSQFIWNINVTELPSINKEEIVSALQEEGITVGSFSKNIDTYTATQSIALKFNNIAWMSINIEGSHLTVNISEAEELEKEMVEEVGHLVATCDGVIKYCKINEGKNNVLIGQAVKKGDILVSGEIGEEENLSFVRAEGTVLADTERSFNVEIDKKFSIKEIETSKYKTVLKVFWLEIPLYLHGVGEGIPDDIEKRKLRLFGGEIPVEIIKRRFIDYEEKSILLDKDMAKNIAISRVVETVKMYPIEDVKVSSVTVFEGEKGYKVKVDTVCRENIAKFSPIK